METFYKIVSMLGGLAMFLYGMRVMGDGLKSSSGGAMKAALERITNRPVMGFILGMLVTCMIQSSTATIVITVGLVGAGFITFRQSIGVVLGANVGTAITAQIIRLMDVEAGTGSILYFFKSDNLAPLALVIGIVLIMALGSRSENMTAIGTVLIGFGILFVGLMNMSDSVSAMGHSLSSLLVSFEDNYFLGFLSGVLVTGLIQSSSAVIGILQSIASSVGMRFCGVFAVIIGVNIGDCITTYLVCRIGAKPEQIRTCLVHIVYNVLAAAFLFILLAVLRITGLLNDSLWYYPLKSGGIANIHGMFRLVPALLFLPFSSFFAGLIERFVPDVIVEEDEEDRIIRENLRQLDARLITNPGLALNESEILIQNMCKVAVQNYDSAVSQFTDYDKKRNQRIAQREDLLDTMANSANEYIIALSPYIVLDKDRRTQSFQLKSLMCFERIGDLARNIAECLEELRDNNKEFSEIARKQLRVIFDAVKDNLSITQKALVTGDLKLAREIEPFEEVIDELVDVLQRSHTHRVTHGCCDIVSGISFQNILLNLERVSDQCSDIGVYILGRNDETISGNEHQYLHNLHHSNDRDYLERFRQYHDAYFPLLPENN